MADILAVADAGLALMDTAVLNGTGTATASTLADVAGVVGNLGVERVAVPPGTTAVVVAAAAAPVENSSHAVVHLAQVLGKEGRDDGLAPGTAPIVTDRAHAALGMLPRVICCLSVKEQLASALQKGLVSGKVHAHSQVPYLEGGADIAGVVAAVAAAVHGANAPFLRVLGVAVVVEVEPCILLDRQAQQTGTCKGP